MSTKDKKLKKQAAATLPVLLASARMVVDDMKLSGKSKTRREFKYQSEPSRNFEVWQQYIVPRYTRWQRFINWLKSLI